MNLSAPFLARPTATLLVTVALVLAGVAAYRELPITALPKVDFAAVAVKSRLSGADAETMATLVAAPIAEALEALPSAEEVRATSEGESTVVVEFSVDRDIDAAADDVRAAVARIEPDLPDALVASPIVRKIDPTDRPVLSAVLSGDGRTAASLPISPARWQFPSWRRSTASGRSTSATVTSRRSASTPTRWRWRRATSRFRTSPGRCSAPATHAPSAPLTALTSALSCAPPRSPTARRRCATSRWKAAAALGCRWARWRVLWPRSTTRASSASTTARRPW